VLFFFTLFPHGFFFARGGSCLAVDLEHLDKHLIAFLQLIGNFFQTVLRYLRDMEQTVGAGE